MTIPPLAQIGVVHSPVSLPEEMPPGGVPARVEIFAEYAPALDRLEEHSHAWVMTWFHLGDRRRLHVKPSRVDPDAPAYGVFALRAASRPNPIALTLVQFDGIERRADGPGFIDARMDAVDGSPVLDIKPYFENDTVFSPRTPYLRPKTWEDRRWWLYRHALQHHLEECDCLALGVRMALIAEERFGHLNEPDLLVSVRGPACLADVLQGVTRARLDHPARFAWERSDEAVQATFAKGGRTLRLTATRASAAWLDPGIADAELFGIEE